MLLIDTHTHAHFNAFKDDSQEVVKRALAEGVHMITVGTQKDTSRFAVELAEKFDKGVYAAIGLHPVHTNGGVEEKVAEGSELSFKVRKESFDADYYRELAASPRVVAIGECGLDYYRVPSSELEQCKTRQKENFVKQLELADELDLPVIIHCRDAYDDVYGILQSRLADGGFKCRGVMHCYTGDLKHAQKFVELGMMVSFSGIVTFSKELASVAGELPREAILIETDAPYLTPVPLRGKRNEPAYVRHTAEFLANLLGMPLEKFAVLTTANAHKMFKL